MWHIDAEIISFCFMVILIFDVFATNSGNALKDKLFKALSVVTLVAILTDIISSYAMIKYETFPAWLVFGSLMLYFIITPMLSMLWHLYAISIVEKPSHRTTVIMWIYILAFLPYVVLVLSNPFTGLIFDISAEKIYARGVLFNSIFVVFYGYGLATLFCALTHFKKIERTTAVILTIFPIIAGIGIFLQQVWSGYLITGAAFTIVILITYLFLQNRKRTRDSLTGIYNRLAFSDAIVRLHKGGDGHGHVMAIAIDDFKLFNQVFGQAKGDEILKNIGEYLVSISPSKICYRYGGDIFTLILKKQSSEEVTMLAETVKKRFKSYVYMNHVGYSLSVSMGIVEYPHCSENANDSIITALDFAIFEAKKHGKGQVAFYNETLIKKIKRRYDVAEAIKRGILENSFEVYIQPIYHIEKKRFAFGEALLRLNDKDLGGISPAEFIPISEETGEIVEITYYVLKKVCSFLKENRNVLKDQVPISVNFSVIQFMQKDMTERVIQIIKSYDISPSLIKIELTESVVADSFDEIKASMTTLREFGVCFALDDYGQGYSNIAYLINLPFDFVKLDKSIIDGVVEDDKYVKALVPMFKSLNKIIVAEGVETEQQVELISKTTCDSIQGYYFAKPVPMEHAISYFLNEKSDMENIHAQGTHKMSTSSSLPT